MVLSCLHARNFGARPRTHSLGSSFLATRLLLYHPIGRSFCCYLVTQAGSSVLHVEHWVPKRSPPHGPSFEGKVALLTVV